MSHHGNGYQYPTRSCESLLNIVPKTYAAVQFPAHQLGGPMELCVIRGYVLSEVCLKRGSTVQSNLS